MTYIPGRDRKSKIYITGTEHTFQVCIYGMYMVVIQQDERERVALDSQSIIRIVGEQNREWICTWERKIWRVKFARDMKCGGVIRESDSCSWKENTEKRRGKNWWRPKISGIKVKGAKEGERERLREAVIWSTSSEKKEREELECVLSPSLQVRGTFMTLKYSLSFSLDTLPVSMATGLF